MCFFTANKPCCQHSVVSFPLNLAAEDVMFAFVTRFARLHELQLVRLQKPTLSEHTTESCLNEFQLPSTLPLLAALQGFPYTSHWFISDTWATSTLPLSHCLHRV